MEIVAWVLKIVAALVAIILVVVLSMFAKALVEHRTKVRRFRDVEKQRGPATRWLNLFRQTWSAPVAGQPSMHAVRMVAHSLFFPFFRSATAGNIDWESLHVRLASVEEMRQKYPEELNEEVIRALRRAFPDLTEQAVQPSVVALEKAHQIFHRLCDLDRAALECANEGLPASEAAIREAKLAEFRRLRGQAEGGTLAEYFLAAYEARQHLLRLGVPAELHAALATPQEVIAATAEATAGEWRGLLAKHLDSVNLEGLSEEQFGQIGCAILLHDSPRWSAYPLLRREVLRPDKSSTFALSNYMFVADEEEPLGEYIVPFHETDSLRKVRTGGRAFCEATLCGGQIVRIPWGGIPLLGKLQEAVKAATTCPVSDEPLVDILASARAQLVEEAARLEKARLTQPTPKSSPMATLVKTLGAPVCTFCWMWSRLTLALTEGGCLFFAIVSLVPLGWVAAATIAGSVLSPGLAYQAWARGAPSSALGWFVLYLLCVPGIMGAFAGARGAYLGEPLSAAMRRMGRGPLWWLLIPGVAGIATAPFWP